VIVLAGHGGNGGGGLAAGRRLSIWGADVAVILGAPRQDYQGVPLHQLSILDRIAILVRDGQPSHPAEAMQATADIVLEALLDELTRRFPADRYVLADGKPASWPLPRRCSANKLVTLHVCQEEYAHAAQHDPLSAAGYRDRYNR
jgi:YjeF-like protein